MSITALVEKVTGRVLNAVDSPSGHVPKIDDPETQELKTITAADFAGVCDQTLTYYNYDTEQLEQTVVRRLVLTTLGPFQTGTVNLVLQQQDLQGVNIAKPATFMVDVNGQQQDVLVEDGTLEIEINCPEPVVLQITVTEPRHETFTGEVAVVES